MVLLRDLPLNSDTISRAEITCKGQERNGGNIRFLPLEVTKEGIQFTYEGEVFLFRYIFPAGYRDCDDCIHFELDPEDGELHIYCDLFSSSIIPYFEFKNRYSKGKLFRAMANVTNSDPMYLFIELTVKPELGLGVDSMYNECFDNKYSLDYDIPTFPRLGFKRSSKMRYKFIVE